jgi:hypothetical protein
MLLQTHVYTCNSVSGFRPVYVSERKCLTEVISSPDKTQRHPQVKKSESFAIIITKTVKFPSF